MALTKLLKYSGFAGVGIIWTSILAGIILAQLNILSKTPLSQLGVTPSSQFIFILGLSASAICLSLFSFYAYQQLKSSVWAPVVMTAGQLCLIGVALTPYTATNFVRPLHIGLGFVSALSIPIAMGIFAYSAESFRKLCQLFFMVGLVFFTLGLGSFIFAPVGGALSQIVTTLTFHVWIIVLSWQIIANKQ